MTLFDPAPPSTGTMPAVPWATMTLGGILIAGLGLTEVAPAAALRWLAFDPASPLHALLAYGLLPAGPGQLVLALGGLWLFGIPLERRIGPWRLLLAFGAAAMTGALAHRLWTMHLGYGLSIPLAGPAAAIMGLAGARLGLEPRARTTWPGWVRNGIPVWMVMLALALLEWTLDRQPLERWRWIAADAPNWAGLLAGLLTGATLAVTALDPQAAPKPAPRRATLANPTPAAASEEKSELLPEPHLMPLLRLVQMGQAEPVLNAYRRLQAEGIQPWLPPDQQLALARLLRRARAIPQCQEALETLLTLAPQHAAASLARFELAGLLAARNEDLGRAVNLLERFLESEPPHPLDDEARQLLKILQSGEAHDIPRIESPRPSVQEPAPAAFPIPAQPEFSRPAAAAVLRQADALFGNPDDTGKMTPIGDQPPPTPQPKAPPRRVEDTDAPIRLDPLAPAPPTESEGRRPASGWSGSGLSPSPVSHALDTDEDPEPGPASRPLQYPVTPPRPVSAAATEDDILRLEPEVHEYDLAPNPAETGTGARMQGSTTTDTVAPPYRYHLLLAPGRKVQMARIVAELAPMLHLRPESAEHAILRRRGILAESLEAEEALSLARRLADRGQAVVIVREDARLNFGPPLDTQSVAETFTGLQLTIDTGALDLPWNDLTLMGTGWVTLQPGTPARAMLDLFYRNPNRHLRLWANTVIFPADWDGTRTARFAQLIRIATRRGPGAIHTRTLKTWTEPQGNATPAAFSSLIEYENYLRWHLMAFCTPWLQGS